MKRDRVAVLLTEAAEIIELGDQRLLAGDGPAGNLPPDISLAEWRRLYDCIQEARQRVGEATQCSAVIGGPRDKRRCPKPATHECRQKHCNSKAFWIKRCAGHLVGNAENRPLVTP